jgi:5'-3' exonuclease
VASEKRLMVLDSASMYFRAFFGVPEVLAPDGTPVNAVRGFLDFISRLVGDYRPTHLVCAWDNDWRPRWRVDLIPSYKAHRVAAAIPGPRPDIEVVPDPLEVQVPVILEVLDAVGLSVVGVDGYEADDVIGSLAVQSTMPVDVVTGDRDLFQLVDDAHDVRVLYIARGVGNHERVTDEVVVGKYRVLPSQYADFATMRGDTSDGLPGVPGIGEKTAASLLLKYGDLRGIVAAATDPDSGMSPGPRRRILDAAGYLEVAPRVVEVTRDLDLPAFDATLPTEPRDPELVDALAERYNLDSPLKRLRAVLAG